MAVFEVHAVFATKWLYLKFMQYLQQNGCILSSCSICNKMAVS